MSISFEGVPLLFDPTFEELDKEDPEWKKRCIIIPQITADEWRRAETRLKRSLTTSEAMSVIIHKSAKLVLCEP